jgi:hypothetical protein
MFCIAIQIKHGWVLRIILNPTCVNVVVVALGDALEQKELVRVEGS